MPEDVFERTAIGIDIGGTKICLGLTAEDGALLESVRFPFSHWDGHDFMSWLIGHTDDFMSAPRRAAKPSGIGVGVKGIVDYGRQSIIRSSILKHVLPIDICGELSARYGLPAFIDNDVHAAAVAEMRFGAGRGKRDFLYINIGTGMAMGVISEGRLVRGKNNGSGELGNFIFGDKALSPPFQTLEAIASGKGIAGEANRRARMFPPSVLKKGASQEAIPSHAIFSACQSGDELAGAIVGNMVHALGVAVINMNYLFDPELFVFGGGVIGDGWIIAQVEKFIKDTCASMGIDLPAPMVISALGAENAGVIGAACVFFENFRR
jgi:glucokinase